MVRKTKKKRIPTVMGNWKMYKTVEQALQFVETLAPLVEKSQVKVFLAVPFTAIAPVGERAASLGSKIKIGAQNMHDASEGAFTGEIAACMLKEAGAQFVILGHSERRHIFGESNSFINKKVRKAIQEGIQPVLCIGETLEQHEKGDIEAVLTEQMEQCLEGVDDLDSLILSYEPVWAIGTGKIAHPEEVQKIHRFCRELIAKDRGQEIADNLNIQYGGSVKPENTEDMIAQKDVDGLLVGGASLKPETLNEIVKHTERFI